ncbi:MAG: hypothetical protein JJE13_12120 [Thermoleophilia bacterium]|nr:hypothetical protein [Thermoleophilia bacterium]
MKSLKIPGRIAVAAVLALTTLFILPAAGSAKTQPPGKQLGGLYNSRYCEIFTVNANPEGGFLVNVFNTVGLNRCPAEQWDAVDFKEVAESQGALLAVPNGPRRWVIDAITGAKAGEPLVLSGLEVRPVATLGTPTLSPAPFTELTVNRTTTWNYKKGHYIRQVISPEGKRYAMQAYTRNVDPELSEPDLNTVDQNPLMALPEGWRYKTRKLKRKLTLRSAGSTRIVRDGLGCVYQKFRWPNERH